MTRAWLRWLPAAVVPAVIGVGVLTGSFQASAAANLPTKTPEEVLAMVAHSTVRALSGTLEQTSELGLPQLPSTGPGSNTGAASALDLIAGSHRARVYADGPSNVRVQVMDLLAERDLVRRGNEVWLYNSKDNTATHLTLPAGNSTKTPATPAAPATPGNSQTPEQLAHRLLASLDPSTQVTVGPDTQVAGRPAYDLVLTPRTAGTLIGSASIAVDSETGLPLGVDLLARGQEKPAFQLAFTELSLQTPSSDLFQFVPPPGATVTEQALPQHDSPQAPQARSGANSDGSDPPFTVAGTGWESVIGLPAGAAPQDLIGSPTLAQASRAVPGGRVLSSALVNVLLTDDGRVFAGSVPVERLQAVAAGR